MWFMFVFFLFIARSQHVKIEEDSFEDNSIFLKIKFVAIQPKYENYGQKRYTIVKERKKHDNLNLYFKEINGNGVKNERKRKFYVI